jgi:hypothetical protein
MKKQILLLLIIGTIFIGSSCKKKADSSESTSNSTSVTFKFENLSDLNYWTQSAGGEAIIDSGAVKFQNLTQCFHYETTNLIPVNNGESYVLKISGKVNESIQGDPGLCAGDFLIYVIQGSTNLIQTSFGNHPNWVIMSYSFVAASSAPIKIKFLIGTTRGAWIQKIEVIKQ